MVQVYSEPFAKRHYASRFSSAYCFPLSIGIVFIILAFVISYSTGQLWIKNHSYLVQPEVKYTYETLLLLETGTPGEERLYSSIDEINELFYNNQAAVDVQAIEQDLNYDGRVDLIDVIVTARGVMGVRSVKLLLGFDYKISGYVDMEMRTLAYIQHASPLSGSALHVDGDLRLLQREPLAEQANHNTYKGSANSPFAPLLQNVQGTTGLAQIGLGGVMNLYLFRNETTYFDSKFPIWMAGSGDEFEVKARIRVPSHQEIMYRPGTLMVVKFGWIQFFSIVYPLLWLLSQATWVVFHFRILQTRVVSDFKPKEHRF
mmetsp:Transcript_30562/g.58870  ORF Transcript_30562/g.58870 Transcript_30562/m.58870 type:complete len:316 (+) Transcript_30562:281-1228(+)